MKKLLFPIFITILILITVILIFAAVTTKQPTNPKPTTTQAVEPYASLSFNPESLSITSTTSGTQSVDIILDTRGKEVFGAQIELQFDPNVISNIEITKPVSSLFGENSIELINKVSTETGLGTYAIVLSASESEKIGKGPIATVRFQVNLAQKSTDITILPVSSVTSLTNDGSVLLDSTFLPITFATQ